jgi:dipeptidyl aminopeptidase/acylaminoacyl peptidase
VCDINAIELPSFASHWHGKPVLVISGENDDRIPASYVKSCVETLRDAGATVDLNLYPQANHFLVFSHRERCLKELSAWLAK